MSFWKTLSEKLGFMSGESDERDEDELEDGEIQDGEYTRQYFFGGNAVGTAVMEDIPEETTSFDHESEQNLEAARAYSENTNNLPYILIGGAGLVVFLLILWRIIKIAKS